MPPMGTLLKRVNCRLWVNFGCFESKMSNFWLSLDNFTIFRSLRVWSLGFVYHNNTCEFCALSPCHNSPLQEGWCSLWWFDRKIKMESIMSEYLKSVYTSQFLTGYHLELMEHNQREEICVDKALIWKSFWKVQKLIHKIELLKIQYQSLNLILMLPIMKSILCIFSTLW